MTRVRAVAQQCLVPAGSSILCRDFLSEPVLTGASEYVLVNDIYPLNCKTQSSTSSMLHHHRKAAAVISGGRQIIKIPPFSANRGTIPFPPCLSPACSSFSAYTTMNNDSNAFPSAGSAGDLEAVFQQKRALRARIRKELKGLSPVLRSEEDNAIQRHVPEAAWFRESKSLCAYISCPSLREVDTSRIVSEALSNPAQLTISSQEGNGKSRKKVYVPRVEDKNSNMRMLKISGVDDLIANSINILEPDLVGSDGNQREDVMQANEPVDLFILPGLAFDKSGRRLGRSGGWVVLLCSPYYDLFLKRYRDLARERKWKQPLLVALSYSLQIMEEGTILVTPLDVPVDALVSPAGFPPASQAGRSFASV